MRSVTEKRYILRTRRAADHAVTGRQLQQRYWLHKMRNVLDKGSRTNRSARSGSTASDHERPFAHE
jgi:hypothetical protein